MNEKIPVRETVSFKPIGEHAMHEHISRLLREADIASAILSRAQFAEAIRQMLLAGDFVKYIYQRPPIDLSATEILGCKPLDQKTKLVLEERSTIIYEPLREVERLRCENEELRRELESYQKLPETYENE